jgi:uncharacterized membrane protein
VVAIYAAWSFGLQRAFAAVLASIIAAFVFTMWDFSNDATFHTINKAFFYDHPGPWFGVPVSNLSVVALLGKQPK